MRAGLDAHQTRLLAVMAADPDPYRDGTNEALSKEWVREDVACALRVPSSTAGAMLHTAASVSSRFPATLALMGERQITGRYAQRLNEATLHLPLDAARKVEKQVLPKASRQTLAQFGASVRRAVLAADPRTAEEQHRDAVAERRVVFTPRDDGTTELWACGLPADEAAALQARIQVLAESWKGLDQRTADQRRADALLTLGTGGPGAASSKPAVNVTVALSTLLAMDEQPGELAGHGPIPAALARAIAADPTGTWRRLVTDEHGNLADVSSNTYRPPAGDGRATSQPATPPAATGPAGGSRVSCDLTTRSTGQLGGTTVPGQPHAAMQPAPPPQTQRRLAVAPPRERHRPLDHPHRPHLRPTTTRRTPPRHHDASRHDHEDRRRSTAAVLTGRGGGRRPNGRSGAGSVDRRAVVAPGDPVVAVGAGGLADVAGDRLHLGPDRATRRRRCTATSGRRPGPCRATRAAARSGPRRRS